MIYFSGAGDMRAAYLRPFFYYLVNDTKKPDSTVRIFVSMNKIVYIQNVVKNIGVNRVILDVSCVQNIGRFVVEDKNRIF